MKGLNTLARLPYEEVIRVVGYDKNLPAEGGFSAKGHKMGWSAAFQVQMGTDDPSSRGMAKWGDQLLWLVRDHTKMIGKELSEAFSTFVVPCIGTFDHKVHEDRQRDS